MTTPTHAAYARLARARPDIVEASGVALQHETWWLRSVRDEIDTPDAERLLVGAVVGAFTIVIVAQATVGYKAKVVGDGCLADGFGPTKLSALADAVERAQKGDGRGQ